MESFEINNSLLMGYRGTENVVEIPQGVVGIRWFGAEHTHHITKVILPDSVQHIGAGAFLNMSIDEVVLSDRLQKIDSYAFKGSKVRLIRIPHGVRQLNEGVFQHCSELEEVVLSEGLKSIACDAFAECRKLTTIEIPSSVEMIARNAFRHCFALTTVTVRGMLTQIEAGAFEMPRNLLIKEPVDSNAIHYARTCGYRSMPEIINED